MRDTRFYWWFGLAAFAVISLTAILFWALFSIVSSVNRGVDTIRETTENTIGPVGDLTSNVATQVSALINPTPTILPEPGFIVRDIRSLARLETIEYSIEKVIVAESGQGPLGFLFGDKLLLVAHGQVIAGIDLSKLDSEDIQIDGETLTIQLPEPEIFVATLDNEKSYIYNRDQGILSRGNINLESDARRIAEVTIRDAAEEDGILKTAQQNAELFLERLLNDLGYLDVRFVSPVSTATPQP
jgi:hypothetical protein